LKTDVNVTSKSTGTVISKKNFEKKLFLIGILSATDEKSTTVVQWYGSTDLDQYQYVTDSTGCKLVVNVYSVCISYQ
jgi:hypothetical protein